MIILNVTFQCEKVVTYIRICSLIVRADARERSSIFNNKIVFVAI